MKNLLRRFKYFWDVHGYPIPPPTFEEWCAARDKENMPGIQYNTEGTTRTDSFTTWGLIHRDDKYSRVKECRKLRGQE